MYHINSERATCTYYIYNVIIPFYADIRYYLVRKRLSVHYPTLFIPEVALGRFGSVIA